jgi:hypothetical protein
MLAVSRMGGDPAGHRPAIGSRYLGLLYLDIARDIASSPLPDVRREIAEGRVPRSAVRFVTRFVTRTL